MNVYQLIDDAFSLGTEQKPAQRFSDQHVLMLPHQHVLTASANTSSDEDKLPPVKYSLQMILQLTVTVSPKCLLSVSSCPSAVQQKNLVFNTETTKFSKINISTQLNDVRREHSFSVCCEVNICLFMELNSNSAVLLKYLFQVIIKCLFDQNNILLLIFKGSLLLIIV